MRKMMIRISYGQEYVVEPADAIALLDIAARSVRVVQDGYSGPYFRAEEQDPFLTSAELVDFVNGTPAPKDEVILPPPAPRILEEESPF